MDSYALLRLFGGESEDEDIDNVPAKTPAKDPFREWFDFCMTNNVCESRLVENLLEIENMCYRENVWYFSLERAIVASEKRLNYPIFEEYVIKRSAQWDGDHFPKKEVRALLEKLGMKYS
jgi:hypothetical protein